jgi:metal-responsive CopG/Arc/MetJ family transcriptional regulator
MTCIAYTGCVTTKPIVNLALDPSLLSRIDDFWHDHRFNARSEAIRWLLEAALDKKLVPAAAKGGN